MSKKYIKAGAGSGKTFKIMEEIVQTLNAPESNVHIQNCIVTTFTEKAAQELKERISANLLEKNMYEELSNLSEAKIGTVHSICADFLKQYGYLINLSPNLDVISQEERNLLLADLINEEVDADEFTDLCERFDKIDFKTNQATYPIDISSIIDLAKANRISAESLTSHSLPKTIEAFQHFQGDSNGCDWNYIKEKLEKLYPLVKNLKTSIDHLKFIDSLESVLYNSDAEIGEPKFKWSSVNSALYYINDKSYIKDIYQTLNSNENLLAVNKWSYFQTDMIRYTTLVYEAAAQVLKIYDDKKSALGLMDFNDMESYMLDLLENETFQKEFSNVIRFVLVDEFQDTNPVQAEIFSKWHEFAGKSFWVGDNKQSIYRFRGADLNFIRSITSTLDGEALDTSYRSRKKIVDLTNQLFKPVFGPDGDYPNNLLVAREEADGQYGEAIRLIGGGSAETIAKSIEKMLGQADHWSVHVKDTDEIRSLKAHDIAILMHKNDDVNKVISALIKRNIPVAQFGKFLVKEDEIIFFNSILSFIANPVDNFAISKIAYYQHFDLDAKKWTEHRVAYRNDQNAAADLYLEESEEQIIFQANYGSDIDFINQLGAFQKSAKSLSITELIDQLTLQFNLDNVVGNWGRAEIRRHNLNTYRGMAQEYQQYCLHFGKIQSVFGFIGYLEKITQTKEFSELENPIGVKVLTYHGSKGLEYPMVIAADMDKTIRKKNIYQAKVQNDGQTQQLAGRWIRFFVDPFHANTLNSAYYEAMKTLEVHESLEEKKEKLRLLYVGLTRPRDYLIFALATNKTEGLKSDWMTQCFGDEQWLGVLKGLGLQSIDIPIDSEQEPEEEQVLVEENRYIPSATYQELANPISLLLNPSKDKVDVDLRIEAPRNIGEPIPKLRALRSNEFSVFGDMIHQVMVSSEMPASFPSLIETYGFAEVVNSAQLETIVNNFNGWTSSQFGKFQAWHEIPFRLTTDENQVLNGIIDLALETEQGWILIDHKTYDGLDFEKKIKDEGYLSQLAYYQLALAVLSKKPVLKTFLHFPMTGNVVEISR